MYKRIFCFALAMLMMCGVFTLSVSALDPLPEEELLEQTLKAAYTEKWLKDYEGTSMAEYFDGTLQYFYYLGEAGCHVFQAAAAPGDPVEPKDEIGDYRFTAFMCMGYCDTNPSGTYAYKDGELMTLKEAYNKGLVDLDLLYEQTDAKNYTMTPLSAEEILENKCKAEFIEEYGVATEDEDEVYIGGAVKFTNYTVFGATVGPLPQLCVQQYIDGYWFFEGAICGGETNPIGMYTLDNYGNVQSLSETVNEGFLDLDEVFEELSEKCEMYLRGDIDSDKRLTVKDATLIQKYLAKVPEAMDTVNSHLLGVKVMDADLSGAFTEYYDFSADVNIKDATYIQKKVANIIKEEELQLFSYDSIVIYIDKKDVKEYTLEDFPEYEFESLERWDSKYLDLTILTLCLKDSGKENVINAVNSLRYREDTEFDTVEANYLAYNDSEII